MESRCFVEKFIKVKSMLGKLVKGKKHENGFKQCAESLKSSVDKLMLAVQVPTLTTVSKLATGQYSLDDGHASRGVVPVGSQERRALVVGINSFTSEEIPDLRGAEHDAAAYPRDAHRGRRLRSARRHDRARRGGDGRHGPRIHGRALHV